MLLFGLCSPLYREDHHSKISHEANLFLACVPVRYTQPPEDLTRKVINIAVRLQEVMTNHDDLSQLKSV